MGVARREIGGSGAGGQASRRRRRRRSRVGRLLRVLLPLALLLPLAACDEARALVDRFRLKQAGIIVERSPDLAYEQLFPYYIELCALSQWHGRDGRRGNPFGHALMYLKGGCKDETAPFPQLRRCRTVATDLNDPEHGSGVSVGRWFRNVNWVAIPGYPLFFNGDLAPGERLSQAHLERTVQAAIDKGVFDGVQFHDGWTRQRSWTLAEFVADQSIGTDFALRFSRNVFCSRIPVTAPVLDEVIAFLNDKNLEYATGKADYRWNLISNNCVHTIRNSLAAANFWPPISVRQVKLRHLLNLAVPANEFVNLAILGSEGPIDDYRMVFADDPFRDALHDFRWLPTRPGALVKTMPVHQPNDLFDAGFRLFVMQSPLWRGKTAHAVRILSDPRYVDLETNLHTFADRYDAVLARFKDELDGLATVRGTPYRRFSRIYYPYFEAERRHVDVLLEQLAAAKAVPAAALPALP